MSCLPLPMTTGRPCRECCLRYRTGGEPGTPRWGVRQGGAPARARLGRHPLVRGAPRRLSV